MTACIVRMPCLINCDIILGQMKVALEAMCWLSPLALCVSGQAQQITQNEARDQIQQGFERGLQGLARVEVVRIKMEPDFISQATSSIVTTDQLILEVESTLRRYHVPLIPMEKTPTRSFRLKDNVGSLLLIASQTTETVQGQPPAISLKFRLEEPAGLKRDPSRQVTSVTWDDEETIDLPNLDTRNQLIAVVTRLAKSFALTYLSANRQQ